MTTNSKHPEPGPMRKRLRDAEEAWRKASANYHETMAQVEAAYMNGLGHTPEVDAMSRAAFVQYGEALAEVVAARQAIPTFEEMLAHPWTQVDPNSEILASIEEYRNALPATAGLPIGTHPQGMCDYCGAEPWRWPDGDPHVDPFGQKVCCKSCFDQIVGGDE